MDLFYLAIGLLLLAWVLSWFGVYIIGNIFWAIIGILLLVGLVRVFTGRTRL